MHLDEGAAVVVVELGQGRLDLPGRKGAIDIVIGGGGGAPRRLPGEGGRDRRARARSITTLRRMAKSQVRCEDRAGS